MRICKFARAAATDDADQPESDQMQTKPTLSTSFGAALVACLSLACSSNPLLVGSNPSGAGSTGSSGGPGAVGSGGGPDDINMTSGSGGTSGMTSDTGAAGTEWRFGNGGGPGTTPGAAGSGPIAPGTPLPSAGADAITRIAQVLWQTGPDEYVKQQAQAAKTIGDLYPIVRGMLADPRATVGVGAFYRWWLDLDNVASTPIDATDFPLFSSALAADMADETRTYGVNLTLGMNVTFPQLMTARFSYINARLADVYGITDVKGTDLRPVPFDAALQREGLLSQPSILTLTSRPTRTSPTRRGVYIYEKFLCRSVPAPPIDSPTFDQQLDALLMPGVSTKQALETVIASQPACPACHLALDPLGLQLELYDAIGRWRTRDNGAEIDLPTDPYSGLTNDGTPTVLGGPGNLAELLAAADAARTCMAKQWMAYAIHTSANLISDAAIATPYKQFASSGFALQELIVAVLTSDAFLKN
jgi:hypothetical protein